MIHDNIFLAKDYYNRGNARRALQILEKSEIRIENSEDIEGSLLLVKVHDSLEDIESAKKIIESLLSKYPDNVAVIEGAIHLFSSHEDTASIAKELCLERIKVSPNNYWYYYILSHICFYYLKSHEKETIEYLNKALELNNYTAYLDHAYTIFDYYKKLDRRDECLELLIKLFPNDSATKAKLFHNLIEKNNFREAAEVALDFLKEFPASKEITKYQLENLRKALRLTDSQRKIDAFKIRISDNYNRIINSDLLYIRIQTGVPLRFIYFLLLPYLLPGKLSSKNHLHLAAFKRDELYRKLCSSRDNIISENQRVLLYCPDSNTGFKVILFEEDAVHLAQDLSCSLSEAIKGFDNNKFLESKSYKTKSINSFSAQKTKFELETTWSFSDIEFTSPDTVNELEVLLRELNWLKCYQIVGPFLANLFIVKVLLFTTVYGGVIAFAFSKSIILACYVGGIPLFYLFTYLRSMFLSSRKYSYRPGRKRILRKMK